MIVLALAMMMGAAPSAAWTRYDEADADLTAAYRALAAHQEPSAKTVLRDDERAWISQRNKNCGYETRGACALNLTISRTKYLIGRLPSAQFYATIPSSRLVSVEGALNDACHSPGQDINGPLCGRRQAAFREMQRRGLPTSDD